MKSNNAFQKRIFCLLLTLTCLIVPGYAQQWELVWSDEFEVDGLPDAAKWGYDVGGNGWGNQELQYYTEGRMENARVEDGHLIIEALLESFGGREYTSARLVTRGKGDWTYGRVEVRAKLPAGRGTWPAIWMLPTEGIYGDGGWPDNGEIDIMEHVGFDPENIHGTVHTEAYNHTKGTQRGGSRQVPGALDEFHDYAVEWSPTRIEFMIDDVVYFRFFNENSGWEAWPFDRPFHLLLNIAVGGSWGGLQGIDDTVFPARMEVDYVRVYENTAVPEVTMTAPASADVGASVTLDAEAAVREGNIARVEFMQGDAVLAVVDEAPYAFTVNDLEEGCYTVSARATSNTGWSTLSDASSLTVGSAMDPSNCPQAPYLMAAHPVPGKIEVEHFDLGGRGVAYLDLDTENQGNAIRTDEGVDIQATSDAGGGYSVGWIASREWLQYTVNVETEGTYTLEARVASPSEGGSLQVEVDGTNISGSVEFGQTGGWQTWETIRTEGVSLQAGKQVIRLRFTGGAYNINWIAFTRATGTSNGEFGETPEAIELLQNYPNPFRATTEISFTQLRAGDARLEVYDVQGRIVATLLNRNLPAGRHAVRFQADRLPGGVYFYRLSTTGEQLIRSMTLLQ